MKLLFLLLVGVVGATVAKGPRAGEKYCTCYSEQNGGGYYYTFTQYVQDLYTYNFNNVISSCTVTGLWFFYDNVNYNVQAGLVYWAHGIDFGLNLPYAYSNMCSSLRFAGSPTCLNCDTWTVYDGIYLTGAEYFGLSDQSSFGPLDGLVSSVVVTGHSPWTFYEGASYTGYSVCLYPNTDHDVGQNGLKLDLGIFPDVTQVGVYDNSLRSVRKGCFSSNVVRAAPLKAEVSAANGAWGYLGQ